MTWARHRAQVIAGPVRAMDPSLGVPCLPRDCGRSNIEFVLNSPDKVSPPSCPVAPFPVSLGVSKKGSFALPSLGNWVNPPNLDGQQKRSKRETQPPLCTNKRKKCATDFGSNWDPPSSLSQSPVVFPVCSSSRQDEKSSSCHFV